MGSRRTIARRELTALGREKTIVLALLIQLFIAAFSSFLVVGLTSLYDPGSVEAGEVRVGVTGDVQDRLLAAADRQEGVRAVAFSEPGAAASAFDEGRVDAVLSGSRVPGPGGGSRLRVAATVPEENLRTTLIVVRLRQVLTALESAERDRLLPADEQPVDPPAPADASPYFGFTYTVLVPLLLFLPPFISGSIAVDAVTEEIERGTLELLRVAPVDLVEIVDGKAAAMVLLAPAQAALWLALLAVNGIAVANAPALLAFVTAVATVVVVLGTVLGLVTARRRQAQLLYSVSTIAVFGAAVLLPEHPATTVAKLAVDSATLGTYAHVVAAVAIALVLAALARRFVRGVDPESL